METEPKEFNDVTLYMPGFGSNIERVDVKWARIWVGPYAQHKEYVQCECIEKGSRKPKYPDCGGYLVVVPTTHAIQPDELYPPPVDGATSRPARYGIGDPTWKADFDGQLLSAKVPILADYRNIPRYTGPEPPSAQMEQVAADQEPAIPNDSATEGLDGNIVSDHEEGIRYQAEREFFQRNPQLAKQAKETYTCVCQACGFDFVKTYGTLGQGFAEAHHLNPLSERPSEEWTAAVRTNIADVTVLCANCHRMIHRRKPALSIEELRALVCGNGGAEGFD